MTPADSARRALITGVTGQDGSYLAELLVRQGCHVVGLVREADPLLGGFQALLSDVELVPGDLADEASLKRAIVYAKPHEVYNLAAISEVPRSWREPVRTADVTGLGVARLLQALRDTGQDDTRLCQASSSEIFGQPADSPQDELTPLCPTSPYGSAKAFAHTLVRNFRVGHGVFACNAILYNHESPRRGEQFVTRKISQGVAAIATGRQDQIVLGNLDARRDWGHAADYVRAMSLMLRHDTPDDYVVASGRSHTLRDLLTLAFRHVGIDDWAPFVVQDPQFMRPVDAHTLVGSATKAQEVLGWRPEHTFESLVTEMVNADLEALRS